MADIKSVAANRKAFHDYDILEKLEAGIALTGTEIKSIRAGGANIREAHARPSAARCGSTAPTSRRTRAAAT